MADEKPREDQPVRASEVKGVEIDGMPLFVAINTAEHHRYVLAENQNVAAAILKVATIGYKAIGKAKDHPGFGTQVIKQVPLVKYDEKDSPKDREEANRRGEVNYVITTL